MAVGGVTSPRADVGETARQLAACFHVLRELVHGSCRWLALEPRLDVKYALADQIHDDAHSARVLSRRLYELRPPLDVNQPGRVLAALLDRVAAASTPDAYLRLAYGELKPRLAATVEQRLAHLDSWQDEPTLHALIELRHRQAFHLADGPPAAGARVAGAEPIPAEVTPGRLRPLRPTPPVATPERDAYVAVVDASASIPVGASLLARLSAAAGDVGGATGVPLTALVHALMHERLCWAEVAARTSHEHPELPGAFHLDMAKLTWDASRHAQALERLLGERCASHWGRHPVSLGDFRRLYLPDLGDRIVAMREAARDRLKWRSSLWASASTVPATDERVLQTLDFLLADEQDHLEGLEAWSARV